MLAGLLSFAACAEAHAANALLVGLLEDVPPAYVGEPAAQGIRVSFKQTADGWAAFPSKCPDMECLGSITSRFPKSVVWIVSDGGKQVGTVTAETPGSFPFYARIGLQTLIKPEHVPAVGEPVEEYSGFMGTPVHRPLIATSSHRIPSRSHGKWSPIAPKDGDIDASWPEFVRRIPLIDDCRVDAQGEYIPSVDRAPKRDELEIPVKWADKHGNAIFQVAVRQEVFKDCDGPSVYPSQLWFYLDVRGRVSVLPGQLGADHNGLDVPIAFADLAGDGKDEAIFLMAGYDRGGYALYYDDFRKVAVVSWIYH
jgi:hypothetical protein